MLLFISRKLSGSTDVLMDIFKERKINVFRFNLDLFNYYKFKWIGNDFEIEDPVGRKFKSKNMISAVFYKGLLSIDEPLEIDKTHKEPKWIKSCLNNIYFCIASYAGVQNKIKLWVPYEVYYPKTFQMQVAKEFFEVPKFQIHWGMKCSSKNVITKPLTARFFENGTGMYATKVDRSELSPDYPWFTQNIADGDRDATVLYINGKVHCYQFATKRGNLTDWRITQGSKRNKWKKWNASKDFEEKIDAFMKKINLKFGRLDFIIGEKEPQFLEVNPVGQFGWLDDKKLTLHNEVADAILDDSTTITI